MNEILKIYQDREKVIHLFGLVLQALIRFHLFCRSFLHLLTEVSPFIRDSIVRSKRTALTIFFTKFRLEVNYTILSSLFRLPEKQAVSRAILSVHFAWLQRFAPQNTEFNHITRQGIIDNRTTDLAKKLLTTSSTQCRLVNDD